MDNRKDVGRLGTGDAQVCFIDFRIDLVIGRTENEMGNKYLCHNAIERRAFDGMLTPRPDSEFYQSTNIRAKVVYSDHEIYFIDANGVVRLGAKKFIIDKIDFINVLRNITKEDGVKGKRANSMTH